MGGSVKKYLIYGILAGAFVCAIFFGLRAHKQALIYEESTAQLVSSQNVEQQAALQLEKIAKIILGDWYDDELKTHTDKMKVQQHFAMTEANRNVVYFMLSVLTLLLSFFVLTLREFVFVGSMVALMALIFGLTTPIMMVTIRQEVHYIGDIVLSFESKGVLGSVIKLYEGGSVVVALAVFLFSVLIPALKVLSLLFVSVFASSTMAHKIIVFFKMMGKWSMVDVFVVALFLVYLTSNNAEISRAEIEVGLYFFLAYVMVSMLVSLSADAMLTKRKDEMN